MLIRPETGPCRLVVPCLARGPCGRVSTSCTCIYYCARPYLPKCPCLPLRCRCRTAQIMAGNDGGNSALPHLPPDLNTPYTTTPHTTFYPETTTPQSQLLDSDDNDHDGDDEQECDPDEPSREHSPAPHPPRYQQQQRQRSLRQLPPQQQQQPQPTPPPSAFTAHVRFHSRVRITGGLRRPRGNHPAPGDSSDSDSPSSSISAPLRYRPRDRVGHATLRERVSRLATHVPQKRRTAAVTSSAASRVRARDREYTPLFHAGMPAAYGAARQGDSGSGSINISNEERSQIDALHREDDVLFGRWPWRVLNHHVSDCCLLHTTPSL